MGSPSQTGDRDDSFGRRDSRRRRGRSLRGGDASVDRDDGTGQVGARPRAQEDGGARHVVGLEIDWPGVEAIYDRAGLPPTVGATASRTPVPVYRSGRHVGRATTTTWSPVLKKMIALATIDKPHFAAGTALDFEITVEAVRHRVKVTVVPTPFFNPERKTAAVAV